MIKNWRITSDIVLMIENTNGENIAYIASPEKKKYEVEVSKLCKNSYIKETIENNDLEIKLTGSENNELCIYLKTNQLEKLGWVRVANFYNLSIWNILGQCSTKYGIFSNKFKAIFSEADIKTVSFISPDMKEYSDTVEEMKRRLKCEIGKKTRLLKPGHRYDLEKETRYYLCNVVSRKICKYASSFSDDLITSKTPAYIYTNMIKDSDKSISDILNNRKFGDGPYDLKVAILEKTSWVDSGIRLSDDFSGNIKDYWDNIITNTANFGKTKLEKSSYEIYSNIADILGILGCQSLTDLTYDISENLSKTLKKVISSCLEYTLLVNWNLRNKHTELEILDTKSVEKNSEALERLFLSSIYDGNINKYSYYQSLLGNLNINFNKTSEILVAGFSEVDLSSDFNSYLKYRFFWRNKKYVYSTHKNILDYSLNLTQPNNKTTPLALEDIFGCGELSETIRDIYKDAINNYGYGVESFSVKSTKNNDDKIVFCCITLDDILKLKKGGSELSDSLKNEIVLNKFDSIVINCKLSDKI